MNFASHEILRRFSHLQLANLSNTIRVDLQPKKTPICVDEISTLFLRYSPPIPA